MRATPNPKLGSIVIYRSRTGAYDVPAIVNATFDTLDPRGVELGHVPALTPGHVHLTVFTPGKPGMRRGGTGEFLVESPHAVSENVAGCYQEWNIPEAGPSIEAAPGTWRWPVA